MGFISVEMDVANLAQPERRVRVRFLADTGAMYTVVPEGILRELGIKPAYETVLRVADGRKIRRKVGNALFFFRRKPAASPVIFGRKNDPALLGITTLEALGLELDPVRRRLKPMPLLLY